MPGTAVLGGAAVPCAEDAATFDIVAVLMVTGLGGADDIDAEFGSLGGTRAGIAMLDC